MNLDSLPKQTYLIWEANALATKGKKPANKKTASEATKVTRITARDDAPEAPVKTEPKKAAAKTAEPKKEKKERKNPLQAIGGYFAGAWYEIKQVRWPNRRATWSMTGAMLAFTAFFVIVILLLDALFKYLFDLILG